MRAAKRQTRQRQSPSDILSPMLAVADRNGWRRVYEALVALLRRWEATND